MFESLALAAALTLFAPGEAAGCPAAPEAACIGAATEAYRLTFVYPRRAAEVPGLEPLLLAEAARARRWLERTAPAAPPIPFSYEAEWTIEAVTPEIASASGAISHFTGGAHGGIEFRTILLDRRRGREIAFDDLFRAGAFETDMLGRLPRGLRAAQEAYCLALTAEVRDRRDDPAAAVQCPLLERQPVALVCGANGRIDTIRALLEPYAAGSWAEGPHVVEFPVDARMLASIKRRYRAAFGVPGEAEARIPARPCR